MKPLGDLSIRRKLLLVILLASGSALVLASLVFAGAQLYILRHSAVQTLTVLADAVARNSTAAISFRDARSAREVLDALRAEPDLVAGALYAADGALFARYGRLAESHLGRVSDGARFHWRQGRFHLDLYHPVTFKGQRLGTLFVRSGLDRLQGLALAYVLTIAAGLAAAVALVLVLSARLQRLIVAPIARLADSTRHIADGGDYSIRVERTSGDEIGELIDDFNQMLGVIQAHEQRLVRQREGLEELVRERTAELELSRDRALDAARAKGQFLANMSHEIRTPMNGVIGMLALLQDARLDGRHSGYLDTATRSADALMTIIDDILDVSKIEAGRLDLEHIELDLCTLAEETLSLFTGSAADKGLELACLIEHGVPCRVRGDPTRLRQILSNLLSNAIKFTAQGEVLLKVGREPDGRFRLEVRDTGMGIRREDRTRLFEPFTQADGSTSRRFGGTGLGLSVCHSLSRLMGGEIGVDSEPGEGACFFLLLPLEPIPEASPVPSAGAARRERCLLVVDHNATYRLVLREYLQALPDVRVMECDTGGGALEALERAAREGAAVDLVLLDCFLPDLDAAAWMQQLASGDRERVPAVILLVGGVHEGPRAPALRGVTQLLKPIRRDVLLGAVGGALGIAVPSPREGPPRPEAPQPLRGRLLVVDDEPMNLQVAAGMLHRFGLQPVLAGGGREAIERVRGQAFDLVLMDVHMPEFNGYDTVREMRRLEAEAGRGRTPVLAISANAMAGARQEALAADMDDYLSKPFKPEELAAHLSRWLPAAGEPPRDGEPPPPTPGAATWDREEVLRRIGGHLPLLQEMIGLFRDRAPQVLAQLGEAVRRGDAAAVAAGAHALKGLVGHFVAPHAHGLAQDLEARGDASDLAGAGELLQRLEAAVYRLSEALE